MKIWSSLFAVLPLLMLCQPSPETGRRQLNLVSEEELFKLSFEQYQQYLDSSDVITGTEEAQLVKEIGNNIRTAVQDYYRDNPEKLQRYRWEFNLIQDSTINAFAMPGGKVGVMSGILPVTDDAAGLAFVLGHEAAHSVANHANERLSQLLLAQLGGMVLSEALGKQPEMTRRLAFAAYGLGAQVGILLPYSRLHESEADRLGLIFMAMAGYNPENAIGFLERLEEIQKGPRPPEFLSTHPAEENRIEDIRKMLPEAMEYLNKNQ